MDFKNKTTHKGLPVTVTAGFDPALHRFWMIVEPDQEDNPNASPESGLIYSNLDDQEIPVGIAEADTEHFKKRLRELEIPVPFDFFARVEAAND